MPNRAFSAQDQQILDRLSNAVIATDEKYRVILWNKAAEAVYEIPADQALGKPVEDLFEVRRTPVSRNDIRRIVLEEGGWEGKALHVTRDGKRIWVDWKIDHLEIPGVVDGGKISVIRDITVRKTMELELKQAYRALNAHRICDQLLIAATDEQRFLTDLCRLMVETCGYRLAWIGYSEEGRGKPVRPVASAGFEEGYLETMHITWADEERGRGPTGMAIRSRQPVVCRDIL